MKTIKLFPKHALGILILSFFLLGNSTFSQPGQQKFFKEKRDKIKAQKIAFITDKLDLSPETAQVFWPVYNEAEEVKEKEMKNFRENYNIRKIDLDELSEQEVMEIADGYILHHDKMNDIDKLYHAKYKTVLTPKQIVLLYEAEKEFKLVLLKQVREHQRPDMPPPGR